MRYTGPTARYRLMITNPTPELRTFYRQLRTDLGIDRDTANHMTAGAALALRAATIRFDPCDEPAT